FRWSEGTARLRGHDDYDEDRYCRPRKGSEVGLVSFWFRSLVDPDGHPAILGLVHFDRFTLLIPVGHDGVLFPVGHEHRSFEDIRLQTHRMEHAERAFGGKIPVVSYCGSVNRAIVRMALDP